MKSFLSRFQALVFFVLSGFDRLRFCGESRLLNHAGGVNSYLYQRGILRKDFPDHCEKLTGILRKQTNAQADREGVPIIHLNSPSIDKEAVALELARKHQRTSGRIALITCQESGLTYRLRKNSQGLFEPRKESIRCSHLYHYFLHQRFGLCYVRMEDTHQIPIALRVENTFNQVSGFKVFRTKEGEDASAPKSWQKMRKGVADIGRRAEIGQSINNRLLESLSTVAETTPLGKLLEPLGQPVFKDDRRIARALNPLTGPDGELLRALGNGDFLLNGFRNRDLRMALHGECHDARERRRQAGVITRLLRLVRVHGLIVKVQKSHRYHLSADGKRHRPSRCSPRQRDATPGFQSIRNLLAAR